MRVTAIESFKNGVLRSYGEGELLEDKIPSIEPFKSIGLKNPCIKLDNGGYVWGFQCWWGETTKFNEKYEGKWTEKVIVEIPEEEQVLPV